MICDTLIINDCSDFMESISKNFCINANHVEITPRNDYLKAENDMIYGSMDHKLYASARFLSGDIIIPKEVTALLLLRFIKMFKYAQNKLLQTQKALR